LPSWQDVLAQVPLVALVAALWRRACSIRYRSARAPKTFAPAVARSCCLRAAGLMPLATSRRIASALARAAVNPTAGYCPMVARPGRPVVLSRKRNAQLLTPLGVIRRASPAHRMSEISSRPDAGGFTDRTKASVSGRCTGSLKTTRQRAPRKSLGTHRGHKITRIAQNDSERHETVTLLNRAISQVQ